MKKLRFLPVALLWAAAMPAQSVIDSPVPGDWDKTYQEVHSVHQSLALAYLRKADQRDIEVFYGENFRLRTGKKGEVGRGQMDDRMKTLVQAGIITQRCAVGLDVQLSRENSTAVVVNGFWKGLASGHPDRRVPYAFTYSRQNGVWKLTEARFSPTRPSLASDNP
jgi:hypothetical protein